MLSKTYASPAVASRSRSVRLVGGGLLRGRRDPGTGGRSSQVDCVGLEEMSK